MCIEVSPTFLGINTPYSVISRIVFAKVITNENDTIY